ncbi:MAG TPA: hypothetical protein VM261_12385 [Kofleriaceae bacterium]|nr:hypothetical protein [Kofleriaceae bacterium]
MHHASAVAGVILFSCGLVAGQLLRPAAPQVVFVQAPPPAPADVMPALALPPPPPPPVAMIWSSKVRAVSSQWGADDWSAKRALGAPDVYPASGDQVNAWASEGADDRAEFLELGFERAARVSAVEIYETYNPGAVTQIELIGASGARTVVHRARAEQLGSAAHLTRTDVGCTSEPIVAVRVTIDSRAVEGWNEIDAVGVAPCAE